MKSHVEYLNTEHAAAYLDFPSARAFRVWLDREREKGTLTLRVHWLGDRMRFRKVDLDGLLEVEPQAEAAAPLRLVAQSRRTGR